MIGCFRKMLTGSVVLVTFAGCATTATIHRVDSADNEAEIVSSDAEALIIRGSNNKLYRLNRERVYDVDHPGNVDALVGAALLGLTALIVASISTSSSADRTAVLPLALVYGLPGAALFGHGAYYYVSSVRAAALPDGATAPLPLPAEPRAAPRDSWSTLPKIGRPPATEPGLPLRAYPAPERAPGVAPDTWSASPAAGPPAAAPATPSPPAAAPPPPVDAPDPAPADPR